MVLEPRHRSAGSRLPRWLTVVSAVSLLVLAGCSGDDDGTPTANASPSATGADGAPVTAAPAGSGDATVTGAAGSASTDAGGATVSPGATVAPGGTQATTGATGNGNGQAPAPTRDLTDHDLCPQVAASVISEQSGVTIGLAESNPSYQDPNCVYYKENAGQAVSVTRSPGDYYDTQDQADEAVDGVGDEAKWSASQSTLFVHTSDATWIVSVFQVGDGQSGQGRAVATAIAQAFIG